MPDDEWFHLRRNFHVVRTAEQHPPVAVASHDRAGSEVVGDGFAAIDEMLPDDVDGVLVGGKAGGWAADCWVGGVAHGEAELDGLGFRIESKDGVH